MKANELMIGDWVNLKGSPHRVSYICPFDIGDSRHAVICDDYDGNPYLLDDVDPIPLTSNMLKVNGFKFDKESFSWVVCEMYLLNGHNSMWTIEFDCESIPIRYVHELQHALRLCGLTDLADNFEIN